MVLVSAVITTHKRESEVVERALTSILAQTYPNIEVFVIDDSPSDFAGREQVKRIVEKYKDRNVTYIAHDTCRGACAARNTGLKVATGEFIAFLDDDDVWKPEKIEKQLLGFINDNVALVYCGHELYNVEQNIYKTAKTVYEKGNIIEKLMYFNFIGSTSFPLLRKKHLDEIGGFDELLASGQDYDVWVRLAQKYEVNYVEDVLVTYYVHGGDQITKNYKKRIDGQERLLSKNMDYLKKHKAPYSTKLIKLATEYAGYKQYKNAMKRWWKATMLSPYKFKRNVRCLISVHRLYFKNIRK